MMMGGAVMMQPGMQQQQMAPQAFDPQTVQAADGAGAAYNPGQTYQDMTPQQQQAMS